MRTRICMRGGNSGGEVGLNPLLRSFCLYFSRFVAYQNVHLIRVVIIVARGGVRGRCKER